MRKPKNQKLKIAALATTCVAIALLTILSSNWMALLWELFSFALLVYLWIMDMHAAECHRTIKKSISINKKQSKYLKSVLGKNEAMIANCKKYQAELKELRTYAGYNTNRRTTKRGDKGNA